MPLPVTHAAAPGRSSPQCDRAAMAVTYAIMILTIFPLARYMSKITVVSTIYMSPVIISFTLVVAFVQREYMFDLYLALVFGVIGYVAR